MGILTQQVELNNERLEIGIVTEAPFIRDTLALLDKPKALRAAITLASEGDDELYPGRLALAGRSPPGSGRESRTEVAA